jgi:hypothetical protein
MAHPSTQASGSGESTPERLATTGNCPTNPKLACEDIRCDGKVILVPGVIADNYICRNHLPVPLTDSHETTSQSLVITQGCRCCPDPGSLADCESWPCLSPPGSGTCGSIELSGCTCWTLEDQAVMRQQDTVMQGVVIAERPGNPPDPQRTVELLAELHRVLLTLQQGGSIGSNDTQLGHSPSEALVTITNTGPAVFPTLAGIIGGGSADI